MKKTIIITFVIVILLAVNYLFGMEYFKQRQEHDPLTSQITDITRTLAQIPEPPQDLEQRLETARSLIIAERNTFPDRINSTQVINSILRLADDHQVKVIPLSTSPPSIEVFGEHEYYVFRLNITLEGKFQHLVSFVNELGQGESQILTVAALAVTRVENQHEEEAAIEEDIHVTASLELAVYARTSATD